MELKLFKNQDKGGWQGESPVQLLMKLLDEVEELTEALEAKPVDANAVVMEAADVANFAYMIADRVLTMYMVEQGAKLAGSSGQWVEDVLEPRGSHATDPFAAQDGEEEAAADE